MTSAKPPRGTDTRRRFPRSVINAGRAACPAPYHGTYVAYQKVACRCPDAREDYRLWRRRQRAAACEATGGSRMNLVPIAGSRRRCQAMVADGWTMARQGQLLGHRSRSPVSHWMCDNNTVQRRTADAMADLYRRLTGRRGPSAPALRQAERGSYAPRWAWNGRDIDDPRAKPWHYGYDVDEVAVQRVLAAAAGHRSTLTLPRLNPDETALVVGTILTTHPNPAARLLRVFEMNEDAGRDYASKVRDRGGVSLRMLTEPDSAHYWTVRPHPVDPPLKALQQTEWAA